MSDYNGGYVHDPEGARRYVASLSHGGTLSKAAPHLLGDSEGQDLMPYLAWYEVPIVNGDGSPWKGTSIEPPYIGQVGNNCTSRGDTACMDLLQCIDAAVQDEGELDEPVPYRTACEATYAFSLHLAGMRGDNGCTGYHTAKSSYQIGRLSYKHIEGAGEETKQRLSSWSSDPAAVVKKYGEAAGKFKLQEPVQIKTVAEAKAWLANRGVITVASGQGFTMRRDDKGICEKRGTWMHQMAIVGYICSDGVPSFVIAQSWGPNVPDGPTPFRLPSFCFRAREEVVAGMLGWDDSFGHRLGSFKGFERKPLPGRWKGLDWTGGAR